MNTTFGERIQTLRRSNGLSQEQLAERLSVTRQSVSKWETGESMPEAEKLIALSDVFGVTTDTLLKGGDPPPAPPVGRAPLACFLRRRGYVAGYILIAYGGLLLLTLAVAADFLASRLFDPAFPERPVLLSPPFLLIWLGCVVSLALLAGGILVVRRLKPKNKPRSGGAQ